MLAAISRGGVVMSEAAAIERFAAMLEESGTGRHHRRPDDDDPELGALVGFTRDLPRAPEPEQRAGFREELMARLVQACDALAPHRGAESIAAAGDNTEEQTVPAQRDSTTEPSTRDEQGDHVGWPVNVRGAGTAVAPRPRRGADDLPGPTGADGLADEKTQKVRVVRPRRGGRARLAALVGVAAGTLAISGVAMASNSAVPGDVLYSVKLSGEKAKLIFAGSDADRGQLHLDFARSRLVEARQVAPEAVTGVLAEMDREITEGARLLFTVGVDASDATPIESVATFVTQHRAELTRLRAEIPVAGDPARRSLDLLAAVEIRANELRAALADGCTEVTLDRFGPKPAC
jgi:hypothetical protein